MQGDRQFSERLSELIKCRMDHRRPSLSNHPTGVPIRLSFCIHLHLRSESLTCTETVTLIHTMEPQTRVVIYSQLASLVDALRLVFFGIAIYPAAPRPFPSSLADRHHCVMVTTNLPLDNQLQFLAVSLMPVKISAMTLVQGGSMTLSHSLWQRMTPRQCRDWQNS